MPHQLHGVAFQKMKTGMVMAKLATSAFEKVHVRHRAAKIAKAVAEGKAVTCVSAESDLQNIASWQQGNIALSSEENLIARDRLRHDPQVVRALEGALRASIP